MNTKTQYDPNFKTTSLTVPSSNVPMRRQEKKKKNKAPRQIRMEASILNKVRVQQQRERRLMYADFALGNTSTVTVGVNSTSTFGNIVGCTVGIAQGAGQAARTADTIWLSRLNFHLYLTYNFSSSVLAQDLVQVVRMTVFQWVPNTALVSPTPASLFQNVTSTSAFSLFDFELKDNYKVLHDQFIPLSGFYDGTTSFALPNPNSNIPIVYNIPLRNSRVDYTPATTTAANHLYIAFTCNASVGPNPVVLVIGRTYFYNDNA